MCLIIDPRSLTKVGGKDSIPSTSSNMRLPHRCSPVGTLETTHSGDEICTRRPVATSTAEIGADERSIMAMTGHKTSQMVRRYIQEANLFKNNALNKIKI